MHPDPDPLSGTFPTRSPGPPPTRGPGSRGSTIRLAVAAAALSALLASGGTTVLVLATRPAAAPAAAAATSGPTEAPGDATATLTRLDAGAAIAAAAAAAEPSVVTISSTDRGILADSGGSGIVVATDGLLLTTTLVAPADTTYAVQLADRTTTTARVVARDAEHGLVLLQAEASGLTAARLAGSADLIVGELVIAIGSPLGEFTDTVTSGIVSGLGRSIDLRDEATGRRVALEGLVQTDAAINAGSSGGPLLDGTGAVVGIIVTSASSGQGIGFAVPIGDAASLVAAGA